MRYDQRIKTAAILEKKGSLKLDNGDEAIVKDGLVYVNGQPMTWDTFTHMYLLDK